MSTTIYSAETKSLVPLFPDASGYYHLVYMIVNKINNKIYIGKHTTKNPYDSYMGSGKTLKAAIKKYGLENFEKTFLYCFDSEDEAYLKESEIVTAEFVKREDTYNLVTGGKGLSSEDMRGENNYFSGKHHSEITKQKMSEHHADFSGENHPQARAILKLNLEGNVVAEYGYLGECIKSEHISSTTLIKYLNSGKPYKCFSYKYIE